MLPVGRRPSTKMTNDRDDGHEQLWNRLLADRSAERDWRRRCHRTSVSSLATAAGRASLHQSIRNSLER
jgi:hypothetical protein